MAEATASEVRPCKRQRMHTHASADALKKPRFDSNVEQQDTPIRPEDFVTHNGLLLVRPYFFDFRFNVKQRHVGRNIIDIITGEFPLLTRDYVEQAFADGRIRVEGSKVEKDTPLGAGQCMRHFVHRHEPPVLDAPIEVLGTTDDVVAVSKPACMPVHVAGQHRKNTVCGRLQALRGDLGQLHPVHRLDKPVSGVLLLARSPAAAARLNTKVAGGELDKVYLARVAGVFPEQPLTVDVPLLWDPKRNAAAAAPGAAASNARPGLSAEKTAVTLFRRLSVAPDGTTSLVECRPKTGRTHQIRVHLQYSGHPIANDWQYGGRLGTGRSTVVQPAADAGQAPDAQAPAQPSASTPAAEQAAAPAGSEPVDTPGQQHAACQHLNGNGSAGTPVPGSPATAQPRAVCAEVRPPRQFEIGEADELKRAAAEYRVDPGDRDALCTHCPSLIPRGWPTELSMLWLHAHNYSCSEWSFTSPPPEWALELVPHQVVDQLDSRAN